MWVIHHCLSWGSTCDPKSWADFLEMLGTILLGVVLAVAAFIGILALG